MSQPAQTQMHCELAELTKEHCSASHYQQVYLKGEELSAPGLNTLLFSRSFMASLG